MRLSIKDIEHIINKRLAEQREAEKYEPRSLKITLEKHRRHMNTIINGEPVKFVIVEDDKH